MTAPIRRPLWFVGAALSIGAGVIHFALGPEHVGELGPIGYGFYLSGALQLGWAIALGALLLLPGARERRSPGRTLAVAGIAINLAILAAWAISRVVGLPAGKMPWTPEAVGRPDMIAGLLEGALAVGLFAWLRGWSFGRVRSGRLLALVAAMALSAVFVGTVVAISPDAAGHPDGHADMHPDAASETAHDHAAGDLHPTIEVEAAR